MAVPLAAHCTATDPLTPERNDMLRSVKLGNAQIIADTQVAAARDAALRDTLRPMIGLAPRAIAEKLTELSIQTPRGGKVWSHRTVQRVMARPGCSARPPPGSPRAFVPKGTHLAWVVNGEARTDLRNRP